MSSRRQTWLTRIGVVLLLLVLCLGGLAARYASQRADHQRLRELEIGRAPVMGMKRLAPNLPSVPTVVTCLRGLVLDHGKPVEGMQVSVSDSPLSVSGDCPCDRPASFCGCREGLAQVSQLSRAGLVEAAKSVISDASGHFELCGLDGEGLRLVWGEHLDGRVAVSPSEQTFLTRPGVSVELHVLTAVPVRGVVLSAQTPVAAAHVVAFTTPPLFARSFTTDSRGRFETSLFLDTSTFVVSASGFPPQRLDEQFTPPQVLVLQLRSESELTVRALIDERPVAGAEVTIGPETTRLTDAQGLAHFTVPPGDRQLVRVTKGDFLGSSSVTVLSGQPRRIDVALKKGVRIRGLVTDEAGEPHPARVRGMGKGKPVIADARGRFSSPLVAQNDEVTPVASFEGCADSPYDSVRLEEADVEVNLKLSCNESANGVVLDAEGKPIEGAVVFLDGLDHRQSATTDATGTFRFHQPAGIYQLKVNHERYRPHQQPLQLPAKDVTLVLDGGGSISGRVVDGNGVGLVGASVTVLPAVLDALLTEVEGGPAQATTDAEGKFSVTGLLAGRLVVSATADSQGTVVSEPVLQQPGEHREGLVLVLDQKIDLSGVVMDEQRRPIPGARVRWDPADEKAALVGLLMDAVRGHVVEVLRFMPSPSLTDVDGRYMLRGLPVSKVKLSVNTAGYREVEKLASRGDTLDFVLEKTGGRVRGRVVDESGRPLNRFSVDGAVFTPDDGRFEVDAYDNTTLDLTAPTFTRQSVPVTMEKQEKDVGDIVMKKGRQLHLEVRSSDGKPLSEVKVAAAQSMNADTCTTKADGKCVIEPLLDLETTVKAVKDGYAPVKATVAAGQIDQPLSLTMTAALGRITGEVFAGPGQPAPARSVFLSGAVDKGLLTDAQGKFSAEGLPEGPYCVSLDSPSIRGLEWAVRVQASATPPMVQLGPVAQGGIVTGSRTLPGRLVLMRGNPGPLTISKVIEASASSLCETSSASVITTITTGDFRLEGIPPGRWSVFYVSFTQVEDKGFLEPLQTELLPNDTKVIP